MIVTVSDYFLDCWIHESVNKCNSSLRSQAVFNLSRVMTTTWRHVTTAAYSSHVMLTEPSPWQQTHIHQHPRMQDCDCSVSTVRKLTADESLIETETKWSWNLHSSGFCFSPSKLDPNRNQNPRQTPEDVTLESFYKPHGQSVCNIIISNKNLKTAWREKSVLQWWMRRLWSEHTHTHTHTQPAQLTLHKHVQLRSSDGFTW